MAKAKAARKEPAEMSFLDHLDELRKVLWRIIAGIMLGTIACYYFAPIFQEWLLIPFESHTGTNLALLAPTEGFIVRLKISLVAGLLVTAPWSFLQVWSFVAPGLFEHERKLVLPVVLFSSLLFLTGAAFSMIVLPNATEFFLGFATQSVMNAWSLGKYVDFVLRLVLAFGIVFELPLVIYFLARFGVVTPPFLRKYRKHMIIGFLVLASVITPPDIFTQVILTLPMVVLYEASIFFAIIARKQYERKQRELFGDDKPETDDDSETETREDEETGTNEASDSETTERTTMENEDITKREQSDEDVSIEPENPDEKKDKS